MFNQNISCPNCGHAATIDEKLTRETIFGSRYNECDICKFLLPVPELTEGLRALPAFLPLPEKNPDIKLVLLSRDGKPPHPAGAFDHSDAVYRLLIRNRDEGTLTYKSIQNKTVYISGPITGFPDLNKPAFDEAEAALVGIGFDVKNPLTINNEPNMTWEHYMKKDIPAVCEAGLVVMLPNWTFSVGACTEYLLAQLFKIPTLHHTTYEPVVLSKQQYQRLFIKIMERIDIA